MKVNLEKGSHLFTIIGVIISAFSLLIASINYSKTVASSNESKAVELYNNYLRFYVENKVDSIRQNDTDQSLIYEKYVSYAFNTAESIHRLSNQSSAWGNVIMNILCQEKEGLYYISSCSISTEFKLFLEEQNKECLTKLNFEDCAM